jgi:hypothetical protein
MRRRGRLLSALLLLALTVAAGCADRERTNPLDPLNSATGGSPAGFRAIAQNQAVLLTWTPLDVPDLLGYEVSRRGPLDADFVSLTPMSLPPDAASFRDSLVGNDTTYAYRLRFLVGGGNSGGSSETMARPGSAILWVADAARDLLYRYTPDGRHQVFSLFGLNNPLAIAVDPANGRIWGASSFEGFVAQWEPNGQLIGVNGTAAAPLGIAPVQGSNRVWIAEARFGEVLLVGADGLVYTRFQGFDSPNDVVFDPVALRTWVVDRTGRRLVTYNLSGTIITDVSLNYEPWRLALDLPNAGVWISGAEDGVVEHRADDGSLRARIDGLARPYALAVDPTRQEVWVVLAEGDEVIRVDASGGVQARLRSLPQPRGLAFDRARDEVWVTTLGEANGDGALWHFTRDGALLQRTSGLGRPVAVAVDLAR